MRLNNGREVFDGLLAASRTSRRKFSISSADVDDWQKRISSLDGADWSLLNAYKLNATRIWLCGSHMIRFGFPVFSLSLD